MILEGELDEWESSTGHCFWNRHSEECLTENVVFLEALLVRTINQGCGAFGSCAARLPKLLVWAS